MSDVFEVRHPPGEEAVGSLPVPPRAVALAGVAVTLALLVAGLWWAKWMPYAGKTRQLALTRAWSGTPIFGASGTPGSAPSLAGALHFTRTYVGAVWKAAAVAILVAAAMEALVPRRWLVRLLSRRRTVGQGLVGGLLAVPCMMCTCCTSPVVVGMRRRGVPVGASVAFWLGNPLLNPAVLAFLWLTLPWQFVGVRVTVGLAVVVGGAVVAGRLQRPRSATASVPAVPNADDALDWGRLPVRFVAALGRYAVILVPEYLVVVFVTGWLSGWLSDWPGLSTAGGPVALLVVAVVGALLVVPTGGEVPVLLGLVTAGAGLGIAGVLLITLPALSAPSLAMVARSLSWRVTTAVAGLAIGGGIAAGVLLLALG